MQITLCEQYNSTQLEYPAQCREKSDHEEARPTNKRNREDGTKQVQQGVQEQMSYIKDLKDGVKSAKQRRSKYWTLESEIGMMKSSGSFWWNMQFTTSDIIGNMENVPNITVEQK